MIGVLSWYEICNGIGTNIGPGLPLLLSFVDIRIGWWRINENNAIQVLIVIAVFFIFCFSWVSVIDLSKELDLIKLEYNENVRLSKKKDLLTIELAEAEHSKGENNRRNLMKWNEFFQIDILLLALSNGIMRVTVSYSTGYVTLVSVNIFNWSMNSLALLHMIMGSLSFLTTFTLVKLKIITGLRTLFFTYIYGLCTVMAMMAMLLLPKAIEFTKAWSQTAYGGSILFLKCLVLFHAQSTGKYLIFNTASPDNANSIDAFRSLVGNIFRLFAKLSLFYFFVETECFVPPLYLCTLIIAACLLSRRRIHT